MRITFQKCDCERDELLHGYFYADGSILPIPILSVYAARHFMNAFSDFNGIREEMEEEIRAAGFPERARRDIESLSLFTLLADSNDDKTIVLLRTR